jgi:hypothetical protein
MRGIVWALAAILVVLWIMSFIVFHVTNALIHLLLVAAVIAIVYQLMVNRRAV